MASSPTASHWPTLPVDHWDESLATLHLWTQIVGKIRLATSPWLNHSWGVPLYVTARGLGTTLVPSDSEGFELDFDFQHHRLELTTTTGQRRSLDLPGLSVSGFYHSVLDMMRDVGMPISIHPVPSEIQDAIPFHDDHDHATYEADHARALWKALVQASRVLTEFRAGFLGKSSPVHFFWGSFDLAVTRFSGRTAPPHPGGIPNFPDDVAQEAYSHEVTSAGFWPGNADIPPVFYAYAYPTPEGFDRAPIEPEGAFWLEDLGEFALPYDAVQTASDPDGTLMAFLESTHAAAADLAGWDRENLELDPPHGPEWWRNRPHD